MANFKTHFSFGIFIGIISVAAATVYSLTSNDVLIALGFVFAIIGSLLPDLDSDEGTPIRIVLTMFATLCALVGFLYVKQQYPADTLSQLFSLLFIYGVVKYGLGTILKKFTHHRGIFHSLPAAVLSFMVGLLLLQQFGLSHLEKLLIAGSLALGYLGHLLLDEIKSATTFSGLRMRRSRSFGTAIKLYSNSKVASAAVYFLLVGTIYLNYPLLQYYYTFFQGLYYRYF